jgi:hypothetical protein
MGRDLARDVVAHLLRDRSAVDRGSRHDSGGS